MQFPNSGGRPYLKLDARDGKFFASEPGADEPQEVNLVGKVLGMDVEMAQQGWLMVSGAGADWKPLAEPDDWVGTPKPGPDYKPAVDVNVISKEFEGIRSFRGNSKALTSFVASVHSEAGDNLGNGKIATIKIKRLKSIKVGQGSSIDVEFDMAPASKWLKRPEDMGRPDAPAAMAEIDVERGDPQPDPGEDDEILF